MTKHQLYYIIKLGDIMEKQEFINKCLVLKNLPNQKYDEPFIIALSGYSGSGKSHIAKILSQKLGLYIVGGDAVSRTKH